MKQIKTCCGPFMVRVLVVFLLLQAAPVAATGIPLMEFWNTDGIQISEVSIEENFAISAAGLLAGQDYEIRIHDDSGAYWGSFKVQAVVVDQGVSILAICGVCLRHILAGCTTVEQLADEGICWEGDFRFQDILSAATAVNGSLLTLSLYENTGQGTVSPLAQGNLRLLAPQAPYVVASSESGCVKELFLTGDESWSENIYMSLVGGGEGSSGDVEVEIYVVTESDFQAGPSAWREVRSAYQDSPQRVTLPAEGEMSNLFLWGAEDAVVGYYRIVVVAPGGGLDKQIQNQAQDLLSNSPPFVINDNPTTMPKNIWKCPSPPPGNMANP